MDLVKWWLQKPPGEFFHSDSTMPIALVLAFMVFGEILQTATPDSKAHSNHSSPGNQHLVIVICVVVIIWLLLRMGGAGVRTTPKGLFIRNWFRTSFVPWEQISSFVFGSKLENPSIIQLLSTPMLQTYVVLKDHSHKGMTGLSATRIHTKVSRQRVQDVLDQLELARREALGLATVDEVPKQ